MHVGTVLTVLLYVLQSQDMTLSYEGLKYGTLFVCSYVHLMDASAPSIP